MEDFLAHLLLGFVSSGQKWKKKTDMEKNNLYKLSVFINDSGPTAMTYGTCSIHEFL